MSLSDTYCECPRRHVGKHLPACALQTAKITVHHAQHNLIEEAAHYRRCADNLATQVEAFSRATDEGASPDDWLIGWRCTEDAMRMATEAWTSLDNARHAWMMAVSELAVCKRAPE